MQLSHADSLALCTRLLSLKLNDIVESRKYFDRRFPTHPFVTVPFDLFCTVYICHSNYTPVFRYLNIKVFTPPSI